jgi:rod shape-determining protein MreD
LIVAEILNRPIIRLLLVSFLALPIQTTFFADVKFFGVAIQLMLALAVSAGVIGGSENGALAGFILGLMFDLVLSSPLGLLAFVYGLAGWAAGAVYSRTVANPWWLNALAVGFVSAFATFAQPVLANWVGVEGWISLRLIEVVIIVSIANMLLSFLTVPLMRWCLAIKRRQLLSLFDDASV